MTECPFSTHCGHLDSLFDLDRTTSERTLKDAGRTGCMAPENKQAHLIRRLPSTGAGTHW
jgi:hypothetical protein